MSVESVNNIKYNINTKWQRDHEKSEMNNSMTREHILKDDISFFSDHGK